MHTFLKKYGTSAVIDFHLYSYDGITLLNGITFTSGCSVLSIDEGVSAISNNLPVSRQNGFSIAFEASEMQGKRISLSLVDPSVSKNWLDTGFVIETYGTSGSEHPDIGGTSNTIDGVTLSDIFEDLYAMANGKISKSGDIYTYYKRDNTTIAFTISAGPTGRIRLQ